MSHSQLPIPLSQPGRHTTWQSVVRWGERVVTVGGDAPVRVQSMTNTDTEDVIATAIQVKELAVARGATATKIERELDKLFSC